MLPILAQAGYAATNDAAQTWWFTSHRVVRAEQPPKWHDYRRS